MHLAETHGGGGRHRRGGIGGSVDVGLGRRIGLEERGARGVGDSGGRARAGRRGGGGGNGSRRGGAR